MIPPPVRLQPQIQWARRGAGMRDIASERKVLLAGGLTAAYLSSAELYILSGGSRTFSATGSMSSARTVTRHATARRQGIGIGGATPAIFPRRIIRSRRRDIWSRAQSVARGGYGTVLLPNGRVLFAGGYNGIVLSSAELYDPAAGTFSATGSMSPARMNHTAILLPNGKVLVAGGYNAAALSSAELYDYSAGTFSATGSLITARDQYSATLLPNGKVLLAGGRTENGSIVLSSAELYDPAAGTFPPQVQ